MFNIVVVIVIVVDEDTYYCMDLLVLRPSIWSLLQSAMDCYMYNKVRQLFFVIKCGKCYYKVRQVLQIVTILLQSAIGITKGDNY